MSHERQNVYTKIVEVEPDIHKMHKILCSTASPGVAQKIGHVEEAFLKFNEQEQYFVEVDRTSADRTKLAKKLRQYVNLYEAWDVDVGGKTFPQVYYSVPDDHRRRVIHSVIKTQRYPSLFKSGVIRRDRRKANVMEELLAQLKGAIDDIASCLDDPVHDEWLESSKAIQTLKEAATRLNGIAHGIQLERDLEIIE